jgi:hypothetical protein
VVTKKLEDFDLPANLHLTWLRQNHSPLLRDFVETTRQLAATATLTVSSAEQPPGGNVILPQQTRLRETRFVSG